MINKEKNKIKIDIYFWIFDAWNINDEYMKWDFRSKIGV